MIPGLKENRQLHWAKGVKVKPLAGPLSSLRIPLCTKGIPDSTGFACILLWQRWKRSLLKQIPGRLWNTVGNPYVCRGAHTRKNLFMLQLAVCSVKLSARNEFLVSPSCLEFIFKVICTAKSFSEIPPRFLRILKMRICTSTEEKYVECLITNNKRNPAVLPW